MVTVKLSEWRIGDGAVIALGGCDCVCWKLSLHSSHWAQEGKGHQGAMRQVAAGLFVSFEEGAIHFENYPNTVEKHAYLKSSRRTLKTADSAPIAPRSVPFTHLAWQSQCLLTLHWARQFVKS